MTSVYIIPGNHIDLLCWSEYRDYVPHILSLCSGYKNNVRIQHLNCLWRKVWNRRLGCALWQLHSANSALGTISSCGRPGHLGTGVSYLLWICRISSVTALSLPRVIKKRIATFTILPQYFPHATVWHLTEQIFYVPTAFLTWTAAIAKL